METAWLLQLVVSALLLIESSLGKLPPTVPPCPVNQVALVAQCQERARQKVDAQLPRQRLQLFEIFTDSLLSICKQVQSYVKCAEFIAEEECEMTETSYVEDHEVLSVLPLCRHKYVYEKHSVLHLCFMQHRQVVLRCERSLQEALGSLRSPVPAGAARVTEDHCRLIDAFQDCVSLNVARQCQLPSHTDLAVLLAKAAVPNSYNCTRLRARNFLGSSAYQMKDEGRGGGGGGGGTASHHHCSCFLLLLGLLLWTIHV